MNFIPTLTMIRQESSPELLRIGAPGFRHFDMQFERTFAF